MYFAKDDFPGGPPLEGEHYDLEFGVSPLYVVQDSAYTRWRVCWIDQDRADEPVPWEPQGFPYTGPFIIGAHGKKWIPQRIIETIRGLPSCVEQELDEHGNAIVEWLTGGASELAASCVRAWGRGGGPLTSFSVFARELRFDGSGSLTEQHLCAPHTFGADLSGWTVTSHDGATGRIHVDTTLPGITTGTDYLLVHHQDPDLHHTPDHQTLHRGEPLTGFVIHTDPTTGTVRQARGHLHGHRGLYHRVWTPNGTLVAETLHQPRTHAAFSRAWTDQGHLLLERHHAHHDELWAELHWDPHRTLTTHRAWLYHADNTGITHLEVPPRPRWHPQHQPHTTTGPIRIPRPPAPTPHNPITITAGTEHQHHTEHP